MLFWVFLLSVVSRSSVGGKDRVRRRVQRGKSAFSANCVKNAVNYVTAISQKSSNFVVGFGDQ